MGQHADAVSDPLNAQLAAADAAFESLDERLRQARIQARLFGTTPEVLIGRYRIRERLGRGAMGTVFLAHDERLAREVAIKVLAERGAEAQGRMLREARALARLSHPNVVTIFEADVDGDRVFLVMEYLRGQRLLDWQAERDPEEVLAAYLAAGRGLAAVHAAGLVHRDFKPANVMVDAHDRVQLIDFGLVGGPGRFDSLAPSTPVHAETTGLMGTPAYMAPEQVMGRRASALSDQFAFCASLYEALAGCRPFEGDSLAERAAQIEAGTLEHQRPLRGPLRTILRRGLSAEPEARWPTMGALLAALAQKRRRSRWIALAAGLGLLLGIGALLWTRTPSDPLPPSNATAPESRPADPPRQVRGLPKDATLIPPVLAARDATPAWREAARTLLAGPWVERVLPKPDGGMPIEVFEPVPGHIWARLINHSGTVYHDGQWSQPKRGWNAGNPNCWRNGTLRPLPWGPEASETRWISCYAADVFRRLGSTIERWSWAGKRTMSFDPSGKPLTRIAHSYLLQGEDDAIHRIDLNTGETGPPPPALREARHVTATSKSAIFLLPDGRLMIWDGVDLPREFARGVPDGGRLGATWTGSHVAWLREGRLQVWSTRPGAKPYRVPGRWSSMLTGYSPRWFALRSVENEAALFDTHTRSLVRLDHPGDLWSISADDLHGYSANADGRIRVWSLAAFTGERLGTHGAYVWSGAVAPDSRRWATASVDHTVRVGALDAPPRTLKGHTATVYSVVFSPDGTRLATGSKDGTARIWSLTDPDAAPVVLPGHEIWAYGLAFSPDGRWLATASKHGVVRIWPVEGGPARVLGDHVLDDIIRRVHTLAFSPDGRYVISACKGGRVLRWPVGDGETRELAKHAAGANVLLTNRGELVTWGTQALRLYTGDGAELLHTWTLPDGLLSAAVSPDGRSIAVGMVTGAVTLIDRDARSAPRRLGELDGVPEMLAFDAASTRVIAGTRKGRLGIWSIADGGFQALGGHPDTVRFVGFDANGDAISAGGENGAIRRWPLGTSDAALRARLQAASSVCLPPAEAEKWLTATERERARICPQ